MNDIYLKEFVFSYDRYLEIMDELVYSNYYMSRIKKHTPIAKTSFSYPVDHYTIGNGPNHVILIGGTHGCEIITVYFMLEVIHTLLFDEEIYNNIKDKYTFHIIPLHNPEGFIISTSQIIPAISKMGIEEFEEFSKEYFENSNIQHRNIVHGKKVLHNTLIECSMDFMPNYDLAKRVSNILKDCDIDKNILVNWNSNGIGIDPAKNSIHQFQNAIKQFEEKKYININNINVPTFKPSPSSYPGEKSLDINCPENTGLYDFIQSIYKYNLSGSVTDKLIAIFSYHSSGGEIYGFPDEKYANPNQCVRHKEAMKVYQKYTNYALVNKEKKYDVNDFYRIVLNNVISLDINMSKLKNNPLGPYSDLYKNFIPCITDNKKALFSSLDFIISSF